MTDWEIVEDVEQLREQISLLTMKLNFEKDWRKGEKELASRIDKAREILQVVQLDSENSWARIKAKEALDALEGK